MTRLLLVDDDDDILESLAVVLEDKHHVTTASNGVEALGLLRTQSFDAMIIDLMMPVMDGGTLIEHMQDKGISVPVVLASASQEAPALAARLGVDHISKPYEIAALEEKLARLMRADGADGASE